MRTGPGAPCAQVMARAGHCCSGDPPGVMFHRSRRCQAAMEIRRLQKSRRVQGEEECLHRRDGRVASGGASVARGLDLEANPHEGRLSAQPKSRCGTYGRPYVCRMLIHRARCTPCSLNPARRGSSAMRWRQVPAPNCRTEIAYAHASAHERQAGYVGKLLSSSLIRDTSVVRPIHGLTSALRAVLSFRTNFSNVLPIPQPKTKNPP